MKNSPSSSYLPLSGNRTKAFTMYEVRGRMVGAVGIVGLVVMVIYVTGVFSNHPQEHITVEQPLQSVTRMTSSPLVQRKGNNSEIYAVVFDAGSTGSRVHVFKFQSGNGPIKLVKEVFEQIKPGLSSYADDPKKAAESLRQLLNIALAEVPSDVQRNTPISLMATAGLRLLKEGVADNILNEVRLIIKEYPFILNDKGVDIMDGTDEGIYSWLTVCFMMGDLFGGQSSTATLDLGGGSTQITFIPTDQGIFKDLPTDFVDSIELFNKKIKLYTHSYLGYGLMSSRFTLLGGDKLKANQDRHSTTLRSVCFPSDTETVWSFGGVTYNVTGESQSSFNSCYSLVRDFIKEKIQPSYELQKHDIYIFSYFYDAALSSGMIESELGGEVTVSDFIRKAKIAFDQPSKKTPFLGLDLLYMYSLLHDGYKLRSKTKLNVIKRIKDVEVSWGLGAAFQLLSSAGMIS